MDTRLKFVILPEAGERTNAQRLMQYRLNRLCYQANARVALFIPLFSPKLPRRRWPRRLAADTLNGILATTLYSLIALAVFASWSNP